MSDRTKLHVDPCISANPSLRAILAGGPAAMIGVGALAISLMAASADPAFAAIKRHREAEDRLGGLVR